jgi:predicted nucleic acid-binding protein
MLHILDTDVVSNLRKQSPSPKLLEWLARTPPEDVGIPLVVVFEIQFGIEGLRLEGKDAKADEIEGWLDDVLRARGDYLIFPDTEIARLQARMFTTPRLRSFVSQDPKSTKLKLGADLIVAATAIVCEAAVVSFNVSDYQQIDEHFSLPGLYHPGRDEWLIVPAGHDQPLGTGHKK